MPGSAVSTMTRAALICSQLTGMPSQGSDDPQRPGPTRRAWRSSERTFRLTAPTSRAMVRVWAGSKVSRLTSTMSRMERSTPLPRTMGEAASAEGGGRSGRLTVTISLAVTMGRVCSRANRPFSPSASGRTPANSISTAVPMHEAARGSSSFRMSASGKAPCLRTPEKFTMRGPCPSNPSRTRSSSGE